MKNILKRLLIIVSYVVAMPFFMAMVPFVFGLLCLSPLIWAFTGLGMDGMNDIILFPCVWVVDGHGWIVDKIEEL